MSSRAEAQAKRVWGQLKHQKPRMMSEIANALDIRVQAVSQWRRVPIQRVAVVSEITGIPQEQLRPDFPWPQRRRSGKAVLAAN